MNELVFPTLDLFVYQLRNGWADSDDQLTKNHENFWKNLPDEVKVDWGKEAKAENTEYIKLLELLESDVKKKFEITENHFGFQNLDEYKLEGYYYPVRIGDTYGLLFDCSVDFSYQSQVPVTCFKTLKKQAEGKNGSIGKTWIISGSLPDSIHPEDRQTLENLAYEACQALIPDLMPGEWQKPEQTGTFLGATVFELWKPPQKWQDVENQEKSYHILIILYPNKKSMQTAASFYGDWLRLFCYRNKIIWGYWYAQREKKSLHEKSKFIIDQVKKVKNLSIPNQSQELSPQQLQDLQKSLQESIDIFSHYVDAISNIEILNIALETNLRNYKNRLGKIVKKANLSKLGDTDLKLLETFIDIANDKYKTQVAQDYASLNAKLRVLENLTNTIRGIVEIKEAELNESIETRDRTFQTLVGIVGVGLGTGSMVASASANFTEEIAAHPFINTAINIIPLPPSSLKLVLGFSILSGAFASFVTWFIIRWRSH